MSLQQNPFECDTQGIMGEERWDSCLNFEKYNTLVSSIEQIIQQPLPAYISKYTDLIQQVQDSIQQILKRNIQIDGFNVEQDCDLLIRQTQNTGTFNYKDFNTLFSGQNLNLESFKLSQTPPSSSQEVNSSSFEQDTPRSDISSIITSNSQSSVNLSIGTLNANQVLQQYSSCYSNDDSSCGFQVQSSLSNELLPKYQERRPQFSFMLQVKDIWGVTMVCRDKQGNSILHTLARQGNLDMLKFVNKCTRNILLEERNMEGDSPLIKAAKYRQQEVVEYLLAIGACQNSFNNYGVGVVHYAAANFTNSFFKAICMHYQLNSFLLSAQGTPLHFAVAEGNVENVKTLIEVGLGVNVLDVDGVTPLMAAVMAGKKECSLQLIRQKFDPQLAYVPGTSMNIMHLCCELDQQDVCNEFIKVHEGWAKSQCLEKYGGLKAIHIASLLGNYNLVNILWPLSDLESHSIESLREEAEHIQYLREQQVK